MKADQFIIYNPATESYWRSQDGEIVWTDDAIFASRFNETGAGMRAGLETADEFIGCVYVKIVDDVPDYTFTFPVEGSY